MYYVYKKSKSSVLPEFHYNFNKFDDFYKISHLLTIPFSGTYFIRIKSDDYKDIVGFINNESNYKHMVVYIEVSETMLNYVKLYKPGVSVLDSKSNLEVFKELVAKHDILFDTGCIKVMYFAIGHSYSEMEEALELIKEVYPDKQKITKDDISKLFIIDDLIYPRTVCISYLMLFRGRANQLKKCVDHFGNDLVLYSIRKTARSLLVDKINYLKTGRGNNLIKMIDSNNIVRLLNCIDYNRGSFKDITTILNLYEEGVTINDTLQKRALSSSNEEFNAS